VVNALGIELYKIAPASKKLQEAEEEDHRVENVSLTSRNRMLWEHHWEGNHESKEKRNKLKRDIKETTQKKQNQF